MNRREFLSKVTDAGLKSSVVVATSALTVGSDLVDRHKDRLGDKLDQLEARYDKLEHHHKNLIRAGAVVFAVSTGFDVITFL